MRLKEGSPRELNAGTTDAFDNDCYFTSCYLHFNVSFDRVIDVGNKNNSPNAVASPSHKLTAISDRGDLYS